MTWKVENRYYLKDILGKQLDETVSEVWLKEYEEKPKEETRKLPKEVYVIRATVPFADSYIVGFSYDEDTAIKNKETLESVRKAEIFRVEKIDLVEGQDMKDKIYLLIEAIPYEYGDPIGFFYDEKKAEKKKKELEEKDSCSWTRYRIEEIKLMEE